METREHRDIVTWIIQYTEGFGQPSGASQGSVKGFPSSTVLVMGGSSLKLLRMDCLTNTELEVAIPWAFSAKHMYWPGVTRSECKSEESY